MISIPRQLIRQVRNVFRRALSLSRKSIPVPVHLEAGEQGLRIWATHQGCAVEYTDPAPLPRDCVCIPFGLLAECEGNSREPVVLVQQANGQIQARWDNGGVPVIRSYCCEPAAESFPTLPDRFTENELSLLTTLAEANEVTDPHSSRYALSHVLLAGKGGKVAATDGRQLYQHTGFSFPWQDEELLIPGSSVFAVKELAGQPNIQLAKNDTHVVFRAGCWTIALPINKDGRFPQLDAVIPPYGSATTVLSLSEQDREFLAQTISRLPGDGQHDAPVTVDLNGSVAIRAQADGVKPTEIVLSNATREGEELCLTSNRHYLQRAAKLGFDQLYFFGAEKAILARDPARTYLWMPLDKGGVIKPSDDIIRIESPLLIRRRRQSSLPRTNPPMTNRIAQHNAPVQATVDPVAAVKRGRRNRTANDGVSSIEAAITLRTALRDAANKTNDLIRSLKSERKQQRLLRNTLNSLKQLRTVA